MLDIETKTYNDAAHGVAGRATLWIYLSTLLFFVVLYWFMTMTGEDISQYSASKQQSFLSTVVDTYQYLPRIGEIYQHLIVRCYEPVARLNLSLAPRFIDVIIEAALLYALTWLALFRRPGLDVRSALATGIVFSILILTQANMICLSRFSCLHNYALGYLITAMFCIPFLRSGSIEPSLQSSTGKIAFLFALGFMTGYSTEVTPAILLAFVIITCAIRHRRTKAIPPWMISGVCGLSMGIILFYASGGLNSRVDGTYASAYEYVFGQWNTATGLWSQTRLLFTHFLFNGRYLWPAFLFFAAVCLIYFACFKSGYAKVDRSIGLSRGLWALIFLIYSIAYLGISSVIRVDDELYGRFMAGIYLCAAIAVAQLADTTLFYICRIKEMHAFRLLYAMAILINCITADMAYAFHKYNIKSQEIVRQVQQRESVSLNNSDLMMPGSPLFNLHQYPILESWANPTAYGARIQYIGGDENEGGEQDIAQSSR
jgi:hypothetical protein